MNSYYSRKCPVDGYLFVSNDHKKYLASLVQKLLVFNINKLNFAKMDNLKFNLYWISYREDFLHVELHNAYLQNFNMIIKDSAYIQEAKLLYNQTLSEISQANHSRVTLGRDGMSFCNLVPTLNNLDLLKLLDNDITIAINTLNWN